MYEWCVLIANKMLRGTFGTTPDYYEEMRGDGEA
jgi:hypothetical protein